MQSWQIVISRLVNTELFHGSLVWFVSVWRSRDFGSEQHFRKGLIVTQLCVSCCVNEESAVPRLPVAFAFLSPLIENMFKNEEIAYSIF